MSPWLIALSGMSGCSSLEATQSAPPRGNADEMEEVHLPVSETPSPGRRARLKSGVLGGILGDAVADGAALPVDAAPEESEEEDTVAGADADTDAEATRTWFPEAFLWRPRVQTDEQGVATLDVTVPDQLTTWRVLALAHDREGQQAGTVQTFDSRLPVYVDPVLPGWLVAGDRVEVPVQAVNSTADAVVATLQVRASGAMRGFGRSTLRLGPGGSDIRFIPLTVRGAGEASLRAELRTDRARDAAQRTIPIQPAGRPVVHTFGSTLANSRAFRVSGAANADPTTEELSISVFPGPLAVLQAEVERLEAGAAPPEPGYGFSLATHLDTLAQRIGAELDEARQRRTMMLAWQRIVGATRAPTVAQCGELLGVLSNVKGHDLVDRVRPRLVRQLVEGQRGDGTWSREARSTLQRVLVETAVAARVLPEDQAAARLRAIGAVERHAREVSDPYTAAVLLASDLATGPQAEHLRGILHGALTKGPSGATTLDVPSGVVNPWGQRPAPAEVLTWAVLALPADHEARGDLASELMSGWSGTRGFGAARADVVALMAIVDALPGATEPVQIVLTRSDTELARGRLDPTQPHQPLVLEARPGGQEATLTLTATPPMAGLAFVATRRGWVPWSSRDAGIDGVEVAATARSLVRGREGVIRLTASAPSGTRLRIEQGLPAGAEVVGSSTGFEGVDVVPGSVQITTAPFGAGEVKEIALTVVPAFAGRFRTSPLVVSVVGGPSAELQPLIWQVRPD